MKTSRVKDIEAYWGEPPPERSARCAEWLDKIAAGWRPNRRIRPLDYYSSAQFYGVYIWEYLSEISLALLSCQEPRRPSFARRDPPKVFLQVTSLPSASTSIFKDLNDAYEKRVAEMFRLPAETLADGSQNVGTARASLRYHLIQLGASEDEADRMLTAEERARQTERHLVSDLLIYGDAFYEDTPDGRQRVDPMTVRLYPDGSAFVAGTNKKVVHVTDEKRGG